MNKIIVATFLTLTCGVSNASVFWTVQAKGIMTKFDGTAVINISDNMPTSPNPSGTEWITCKDNWIYFHKAADGTIVEDKYVDRMLSVALSAIKSGTHLRISVDRDSNNRCYTNQMYDLGS